MGDAPRRQLLLPKQHTSLTNDAVSPLVGLGVAVDGDADNNASCGVQMHGDAMLAVAPRGGPELHVAPHADEWDARRSEL
jgi:hypothetical protein